MASPAEWPVVDDGFLLEQELEQRIVEIEGNGREVLILTTGGENEEVPGGVFGDKRRQGAARARSKATDKDELLALGVEVELERRFLNASGVAMAGLSRASATLRLRYLSLCGGLWRIDQAARHANVNGFEVSARTSERSRDAGFALRAVFKVGATRQARTLFLARPGTGTVLSARRLLATVGPTIASGSLGAVSKRQEQRTRAPAS